MKLGKEGAGPRELLRFWVLSSSGTWLASGEEVVGVGALG